MDLKPLSEALKDTPIIPAVKSREGLEKSLACECEMVFVLFGDVLSVAGIVSKLKTAGKTVFVHIDLIEGLASRDISVDFLAQSTGADGIISTKSGIVRRAKAQGLFTIQRFFVLDSMALLNIEKQIPFENVDAIEILPGAMPKAIKKVAGLTRKPVIASGLINDKEDVMNALGAGATSVTTTNQKVWLL
ncbi:MAG: glycerol-3-phosphate responsive antiterminator [Oscillospiraceae bacterium]|nr:glycerol-3-phosphate responsive antiterminator [Oscillospiraceae bacterium]